VNQFLGAIILTVVVVFSFFLAVRYSVVHKYDVEATVNFDEETFTAVVTEEPNKQDRNFPFIISIKILESSNDLVTFDIVAYSPNDGQTYTLSALPEESGFVSNDQMLQPGMNVERVSVFFDPNNSFKRSVETEYMLFFIEAKGDRTIDKTYVRKANFLKSWRKIRTKGIFLRRSEFYTK